MPIRSPRGLFGQNWSPFGPLLHEKSPFQTCEGKKILETMGSMFVYELIEQINIEKVKFVCL